MIKLVTSCFFAPYRQSSRDIRLRLVRDLSCLAFVLKRFRFFNFSASKANTELACLWYAVYITNLYMIG